VATTAENCNLPVRSDFSGYHPAGKTDFNEDM
jgi:hypothetical protein